jgi:cobalt-zinc-cadmium efflux system membrane fusion protein
MPMPSPPQTRRDPISSAPPVCRSPRYRPELPVNKPVNVRMTERASRLAASLALTMFIAACGRKPDAAVAAAAEKPTSFKVTDAQRSKLTLVTLANESFRPSIEVTGTVAFDGDKSTQVLSPVSGPVSRIVATLGEQVTAGQTLATVASPDFAADVATYRKAVTAAQNATRILKLDEQLFANDALARTDLEQARSDSATADADRDAALLALRSLGVPDTTIDAIRDGKRMTPVQGTIVAPIPGTVVEKLINPGQLLAAGSTAAFTVADLSTMWVIASVYAADLPLVTKGESVDIAVDETSKPVEGHVDYVAPIVDPGTKAATVRIVSGNPAQLLKRDMFVRMLVHSSHELHGILVPVASVLRDDDNLPFVFIANADGGFTRRRVTVGHRVGQRYEIVSGLTAGEKVVGDGALFIQFAESQ